MWQGLKRSPEGKVGEKPRGAHRANRPVPGGDSLSAGCPSPIPCSRSLSHIPPTPYTHARDARNARTHFTSRPSLLPCRRAAPFHRRPPASRTCARPFGPRRFARSLLRDASDARQLASGRPRALASFPAARRRAQVRPPMTRPRGPRRRPRVGGSAARVGSFVGGSEVGAPHRPRAAWARRSARRAGRTRGLGRYAGPPRRGVDTGRRRSTESKRGGAVGRGSGLRERQQEVTWIEQVHCTNTLLYCYTTLLCLGRSESHDGDAPNVRPRHNLQISSRRIAACLNTQIASPQPRGPAHDTPQPRPP